MLPGLDGTGELFEEFSNHLPSSLSKSFCRYSCDPSLGYDELQEFAEQILPIDAPYVVLGESFSGPIAIRIASRRPEFLKGLVLVNTFLSCPRPSLGNMLPLIPDSVLRRPPSALIKYMVKECENDSFASEKVSSIIVKLKVSLVRSRLQSIREIDVSWEASEVKVPVCILQSVRDTFIPRVATRSLNSAFIDAMSIAMPGNHFLLQTFPKKSAATVARFCGELSQGQYDEA